MTYNDLADLNRSVQNLLCNVQTTLTEANELLAKLDGEAAVEKALSARQKRLATPSTGEYYYYISGEYVVKACWDDSESALVRHRLCNCFHGPGITREGLCNSDLLCLGEVERLAYMFAPDKWLTPEQRRDMSLHGYNLQYYHDDKTWRVRPAFTGWITGKWYVDKQTAVEFAEYLTLIQYEQMRGALQYING